MAVTSAKGNDVAKYIFWKCLESRGERVSALKLHKLMFYSQAYHLALYDQPLFGDCIEAWAHGPVVPSITAASKDDSSLIDWTVEVPSFPICVSEHLDLVLDAYGSHSGNALEQLTHGEPPWANARVGLLEGAKPTIGHASLTAFYRTQIVLDDVKEENRNQIASGRALEKRGHLPSLGTGPPLRLNAIRQWGDLRAELYYVIVKLARRESVNLNLVWRSIVAWKREALQPESTQIAEPGSYCVSLSPYELNQLEPLILSVHETTLSPSLVGRGRALQGMSQAMGIVNAAFMRSRTDREILSRVYKTRPFSLGTGLSNAARFEAARRGMI